MRFSEPFAMVVALALLPFLQVAWAVRVRWRRHHKRKAVGNVQRRPA